MIVRSEANTVEASVHHPLQHFLEELIQELYWKAANGYMATMSEYFPANDLIMNVIIVDAYAFLFMAFPEK